MPTSPAAIRPLQSQLVALFHGYLERISGMERRGEAREESFYPRVADLLEGYAELLGWRGLRVLILPRKTNGCLLDLQVRRGEGIVGYVEAKPPGTDLTRVAETEQLRRYCAAFPNLLLTSFRELRLYRGRELAARAEIGRADAGPLLDLFWDFAPPATASAAELAPRMALRTRILADRIRERLDEDADLQGFYEAFSEHLLAGLTREGFADLYAQTLVYGLLAARWRARDRFDRRIAAESIPATSGLLRDAFRYISLADPSPEVAWIVDEIVDLLAHSSVREMLERSGRRGRDPVLDFYETFLRCYDAGLRRRRGVYYTPPELASSPSGAGRARESLLGGRIKKEARINVVLGNPPWSGHSANPGTRPDGYEPLQEKGSKWLRNDYLKFLRFAQAKVDEAGEGIVALVTDHGYLDNPTFRGVRRSLLQTFDELYLLDLHGNGKKKERTPDGAKDANVFTDVWQGAAVAILVKRPGLPKRVARADLWGSRATKLHWLEEHDVETTDWREVDPAGPAFLFAPRDAALEREYGQGVPLPGIFPVHSVGIVTGRNAFAIDTDPAGLERRVGRLRSETVPDEVVRHEWGAVDRGRCRLEEARRRIRADAGWPTRLRRILFQPFDWRTVFYAEYALERPREEVLRHLLPPGSLGLIAPRQHKEEPGALVADTLVAHKAVSAFDINSVFPLYLHSEGGLYGAGRKANLDPAFLRRMADRLGEEPSPELTLQYVYAVLYSPPYRRRYAALLRTDFPRVPLPPGRGAFLELAGLGAVLISLHLLESDRLDRPGPRFEEGSGKLDGRRDFRDGRVIVNAEGQAFEGISQEVWDYRIGGYQVLDRWLAGRSGRALRLREIEDFRRIAEALRWTIESQRRIGLLWGAAFQGSWGQECLG